MVLYHIRWFGQWKTDKGRFKFSGQATAESLERCAAIMEQAGKQAAPIPADLEWDEPCFELRYEVSRHCTADELFGLDLALEAIEAGVELSESTQANGNGKGGN